MNNEKLKNILLEKNISNKKYKNIVRGQILKYVGEDKQLKDKYFYISGYTNDLFEIKSLNYSNNLIFKRKQMQISKNIIFKNYVFCDIDHLGNVYNIKKIDDFFV